jgi:hypothetical protein
MPRVGRLFICAAAAGAVVQVAVAATEARRKGSLVRPPALLARQQVVLHRGGATLETEPAGEGVEPAGTPPQVAWFLSSKAATLPPLTLQHLRYTAYASELAEGFRPMITSTTIMALYGVTISYIISTILATSRVSAEAGSLLVIVRATIYESIFQLIANLILPTRIVHLLVHESKHLIEYFSSRVPAFLVSWGPTAIGLSVVPFLPRLDPFFERVIERGFELIWPIHGSGHMGAGASASLVEQLPPEIDEAALEGLAAGDRRFSPSRFHHLKDPLTGLYSREAIRLELAMRDLAKLESQRRLLRTVIHMRTLTWAVTPTAALKPKAI